MTMFPVFNCSDLATSRKETFCYGGSVFSNAILTTPTGCQQVGWGGPPAGHNGKWYHSSHFSIWLNPRSGGQC
jgi:hypothetical protein